MRQSLSSLLLPLLLVGACQSVPEGRGEYRSRHDRITEEELDEIPGTTARQAIQRLRPSWLRARVSTVRGTGEHHTAVVFLDGVPLGGLEALDQLWAREIGEIRFLSASDATNRYGTGYPGGVIEVFTRRVP